MVRLENLNGLFDLRIGFRVDAFHLVVELVFISTTNHRDPGCSTKLKATAIVNLNSSRVVWNSCVCVCQGEIATLPGTEH